MLIVYNKTGSNTSDYCRMLKNSTIILSVIYILVSCQGILGKNNDFQEVLGGIICQENIHPYVWSCFTLSPGSIPLVGLSWLNNASYFLFSSGLTRKLILGAGVPRGAAATLKKRNIKI